MNSSITHGPPLSAPEIDRSIKYLLTGLATEEAVQESLGLSAADLRATLELYGLCDVGMMPSRADAKFNVEYIDIGRDSFVQPRFDDVVDALSLGDPGLDQLTFSLSASSFRSACVQSLPCPSSAIIFQVGRCGSTLLCNLLTSVLDAVAIKEPDVINRLILQMSALPKGTMRDESGRIISHVIRSLTYGARHNAAGYHRFSIVKLTSWNLLFASDFVPHIAGTPIIFLARNPWSTVASMLDQPPGWFVAAHPNLLDRDREFMAKIFATEWNRNVEAALKLPSESILLLYEDLVDDPITVIELACRYLGKKLKSDSAIRLAAVMRTYSKSDGYEFFDPDNAHKRAELGKISFDVVDDICAQTWNKISKSRT